MINKICYRKSCRVSGCYISRPRLMCTVSGQCEGAYYDHLAPIAKRLKLHVIT